VIDRSLTGQLGQSDPSLLTQLTLRLLSREAGGQRAHMAAHLRRSPVIDGASHRLVGQMGDWTKEVQFNASRERETGERAGGGSKERNKSSKEGKEESENTWRGKNKEVRQKLLAKGEELRTRQPIGNVFSTCDILPDRVCVCVCD